MKAEQLLAYMARLMARYPTATVRPSGWWLWIDCEGKSLGHIDLLSGHLELLNGAEF